MVGCAVGETQCASRPHLPSGWQLSGKSSLVATSVIRREKAGTDGKQLRSPRRAAPFASCGWWVMPVDQKQRWQRAREEGKDALPGDKFGKRSLGAFLLAWMAADENKVVLNYWESIFPPFGLHEKQALLFMRILIFRHENYWRIAQFKNNLCFVLSWCVTIEHSLTFLCPRFQYLVAMVPKKAIFFLTWQDGRAIERLEMRAPY